MLRLIEMQPPWLALGLGDGWTQAALMLAICLLVCVLLYLCGTVCWISLQSCWAIFKPKSSESTQEY